jgi:hypothetical protein
MATTYTLIQSVVVPSGNQANIDFTAIPNTFTDLEIVYSARANRADLVADGVFIRFNADYTTANYNNRGIIGSGSGNASADYQITAGRAGLTNALLASSASIFGTSKVYIPNYTGGQRKVWSADGASENNGTQAYLQWGCGRWTGTAAITQIRIFPEVGTLWIENTTAYLYGIKNS